MRLTVLALAGGLVAAMASPAAAAEPKAQPDPTREGPMVHLFQWPWESVGNECQDVLGPNGYAGVQVSPPQEHVVLTDQGHPWYQDYQPVSYQLETRRGSAEQFAAMVSSCNAAGVNVYVDAVVNHMTGSGSVDSGPGSAGSEFSKYEYPGIFADADFGECRRDIENYDDQWEVRNCELVGLADLKTGSEKVRTTQLEYLNRLVGMGVAGFRVDGAKHMPPEDIGALVAGLDEVPGTGQKPYVFQEVIGDATTSPAEYVGNGDVTEFTYHHEVSNAFADGAVSGLNTLADSMSVGSDQAVVFVDNHDTQRSSPTLTYKDGARHDLANAFAVAYGYGTPKVMSSYTFDDPDSSPPADAGGITTPVDCDAAGWACEHRNRTIAGTVGLANTAGGAEVNNWWDNGHDQIAFGRGEAAFAAFNAGKGEMSGDFASSLPAGTYCDVMSGALVDGSCTGGTVEVAQDGTVSTTIPGTSGIALHTGAKLG